MLASVILFPFPREDVCKVPGQAAKQYDHPVAPPDSGAEGPGERAVSWAFHLLVMLFVRIENFTPPEMEA
jgi:hypothetical protein